MCPCPLLCSPLLCSPLLRSLLCLSSACLSFIVRSSLCPYHSVLMEFPPLSCTPLCSLLLSALPAERADLPRIPGLKIVEAHCSGQNAERFWKERKVRFRAQAAIRRTTKSGLREKMADFGGCAQGKHRPGVCREYGNFRRDLAVSHTQPHLPATRIIM
jgi:hypothetical protein